MYLIGAKHLFEEVRILYTYQNTKLMKNLLMFLISILLFSCVDSNLPEETLTNKQKISSAWFSVEDSTAIVIGIGRIDAYKIKNDELYRIAIISVGLNFPKKVKSWNRLDVVKDKVDTICTFNVIDNDVYFRANGRNSLLSYKYTKVEEISIDSLKFEHSYLKYQDKYK